MAPREPAPQRAMPRPEELEEFRFTYGDPRPVLLRYLASWPEVDTHARGAAGRYDKGQVHAYRCGPSERNPARSVRGLRSPAAEPLARLARLVRRGTRPLVAIPVLVHNKTAGCPPKSARQHGVVMLYNRVTQEIDHIDIKRYHLAGYGSKRYVSRLVGREPALVAGADPAADITHELDVPLSLLRKLGIQRSRDAYPMYVLTYLEMRAKHPQKNAQQVRAAMQRLAPSTFARAFERYVAFRASLRDADPCRGAGLVRNMETGRCMRPGSAAFRKHLVAPRCAGSRPFDSAIDVLSDEASRYYVKNTAAFVKPGAAAVIDSVMAFLVHKYPFARFVHGPGGERRIKWTNTGAGTRLELPPRYWELFEDGLLDPRIRFLITPVRLVGHDPRDASHVPVHANVLIYDKDTNECERFDPHGYTAGFYRIDEFDDAYEAMLEEYAAMFPGGVAPAYLEPEDFCPAQKRGGLFQAGAAYTANVRLYDDHSGTCDSWRWWYVNLRLANPRLDRARAVALAHAKLEAGGDSVYKFIKSYQYYLVRAAREHARGGGEASACGLTRASSQQ